MSNNNIIFIDEGFGCLDRENFIEVASILDKIKSNFSAMILITHISELKTYASKSITISKDKGFSQLQYGHLTDKEMILCSEEDIKKQSKDVKKFKEETKIRKEETKVRKQVKVIEIEKPENILIERRNKVYYCKGCKKERKLTENSIPRHLASKTYQTRHNKFLMATIKE